MLIFQGVYPVQDVCHIKNHVDTESKNIGTQLLQLHMYINDDT